ncbi:hypothetical protein HY375_00745 [Candidatus Berkelbacteria bacterium]|nr:hypothetical protein [Candidatus Berkelbacteria bacterium]
MKVKATITRGAPSAVIDAFGGEVFAEDVLKHVIGDVLGAVDPSQRPAEYFVQEPDLSVCVHSGCLGVVVQLSGVSRGDRSPDSFLGALQLLEEIAIETIKRNRGEARLQLFCVIALDGDVPAGSGVGGYSSLLETKACWIGGEPEEDLEGEDD